MRVTLGLHCTEVRNCAANAVRSPLICAALQPSLYAASSHVGDCSILLPGFPSLQFNPPVQVALEMSKLSEFTGRQSPTVIT